MGNPPAADRISASLANFISLMQMQFGSLIESANRPDCHREVLCQTEVSKKEKAANMAAFSFWLHRLEAIARYFAFEKGAYCPNLRLEERMANETDEWIGVGGKGG